MRRWRSRDVEHVCAVVLAELARGPYSLRGLVERMRPPVPRSLLNATCLNVLRNYKLLERLIHVCGDTVPPRFGYRYWLRIIGAYEAAFRESEVPLGRVVEKTGLGYETAACIRGKRVDDAVSGIRDPLRRLAVKYSVPRWVVEELARLSPPGGLEALLKAFQEPTPLWLRVNTRLLDRSEAVGLLRSRYGIVAVEDPVLPDMVKVVRAAAGALAELPRHMFYPEDRAPAAAVHMFAKVFEGSTVADFFSAPGNKVAHLAWLRPGVFFASVESSLRRLMSEKSLHISEGVTLGSYALSLAEYAPFANNRFDAAIVDPDCTSIGRLGHSPETRVFLEIVGRGVLRRLTRVQVEGLRSALRVVRPGGVVLYTTCTLTLVENEGVLRAVMDAAEPVEVDVGVGVVGLDGVSRRFYPHLEQCTGGFAAVLRKRS